MEDENTRVVERPEKDVSVRRPAVTVSYAQTLDGRIAAANGSSQWISSADSLRLAHELRAGHDAILVGAGTARSDDPSLTVRHCEGENPLRVLVDSTLRTPLSATIFSDGEAGRTLVATTEAAPLSRRAEVSETGANVVVLPADGDGRVDLGLLLERLPEFGVGSVMVEGGAAVITSLFRGRLVDSVAICIAPKILGSGVEAIGEIGIDDLDDCISLTDFSLRQCGPDFVVSGTVEYRDEESAL